jgi:hypothetical protein
MRTDGFFSSIVFSLLPDLSVEIRDMILRRPDGDYIYVNDDGSARELTLDEREYVAKRYEFHPNDGGRPHIKSRYKSCARLGDTIIGMGGFLHRLPKSIAVQPAALEEK